MNYVNPDGLPHYNFHLGELSPKRQTLPGHKHSTRATFFIFNKSDEAVTFWLEGYSQTGECQLEFEAPVGSARVTAPANLVLTSGEKALVQVWITLPPAPLVALSRPSHRFTVTTTLMAERRMSRSLTGRVETKPWLGPWPILIFVCLVTLSIWLVPVQLWSGPQVKVEAPPTSVPTPITLVNPAAAHTTKKSQEGLAGENQAGVFTYQQMFEEVGAEYNLDWHLLAELAYQESHFDPWAIGSHNEMGLMQIKPATWQEWAPQVGVGDPYDPYSNTRVAAAYLVYLRDYSWSWGYTDTHWMLVGYNWGPSNLYKIFTQKKGWDEVPEPQRQYALNIIQLGPEVTVWRREQLREEVPQAN